MALTPAEKQQAYRARQKAQAALAAFDASTGYVHRSEWNAPEEPAPLPMTAAQRKAAQRERQKAIKAMTEPPKLLKMLAEANKPVLSIVPAPDDLEADLPVFDSVICDWLTITHTLRNPHPIVNDGRILRIAEDGTTEWTSECWKTLKCPSSDTSLRIKCDGLTLKMTGNIGRYGQADNLNGHTVIECVEMWRKLVAEYFPKITCFLSPDSEMVNRETGEVKAVGTRITRCDLAGNFSTDNYAALCQQVMVHRIGQLQPRMGKYGPTWGYDSNRSNWLRAKLYDKECELEGRRIPAAGATTARFEVQLGSEILKREGLNVADGWAKGKDMENIVYGRFSAQVFKQQAVAEVWKDIPPRLRQYAVLWRDGTALRNQCNSERSYYRILKQLREYGVDASQPCNITTLTRRIEVIKVQPLPARRVA